MEFFPPKHLFPPEVILLLCSLLIVTLPARITSLEARGIGCWPTLRPQHLEQSWHTVGAQGRQLIDDNQIKKGRGRVFMPEKATGAGEVSARMFLPAANGQR